MESMQWVAVFLLFVLFFGITLLLFIRYSIPSVSLPSQGEYYAKTLLTKSEQAFYYVLIDAVKHRYYVTPQVRLADIIQPRQINWNTLRPITSKGVDFVLCDPETFMPLIVIELDDSSHRMEHRQRRDVFVNEALRGAGIKVIRQPVQKNYDRAQLVEAIRA